MNTDKLENFLKGKTAKEISEKTGISIPTAYKAKRDVHTCSMQVVIKLVNWQVASSIEAQMADL